MLVRSGTQVPRAERSTTVGCSRHRDRVEIRWRDSWELRSNWKKQSCSTESTIAADISAELSASTDLFEYRSARTTAYVSATNAEYHAAECRPPAVSYAAIQHSNQQSQLTGVNPIYTAHATSVSVVQAQKMHMPNYVHQAQPGISGQPATSQATGANQSASIGMMQASSVPSHFVMSSSATQQNIHSIPPAFIVDQQQPSSLGSIDYSQVHIGNVMTSITGAHQQHVAQPQMTSGVAKAANISQIATGIAKITTFVTPQKQDEQLTSSIDGTLSGSLISSAVSDSTVSSSSSMTEEAQQDQV